MSELLSIPGIGPNIRSALEVKGIRTKSDLVRANIQDLTTIRGVSALKAESFIKAANGTPTTAAVKAAEPVKAPSASVTPKASVLTPKASVVAPKATPPGKADVVPKAELAPKTAATPKASAKQSTNIVNLVPKKSKGNSKADAKVKLKACKSVKKEAKAKLKLAEAKLARAVKALEKAEKGALKDKTKTGKKAKQKNKNS